MNNQNRISGKYILCIFWQFTKDAKMHCNKANYCKSKLEEFWKLPKKRKNSSKWRKFCKECKQLFSHVFSANNWFWTLSPLVHCLTLRFISASVVAVVGCVFMESSEIPEGTEKYAIMTGLLWRLQSVLCRHGFCFWQDQVVCNGLSSRPLCPQLLTVIFIHFSKKILWYELWWST